MSKLDDLAPVLTLIALAVDELDKNECANHIISTAIASTLEELGYGDVDSYASATQLTNSLGIHFAANYYKEQSYGHKQAVIMGAVKTAINLIQTGGIDERIREVCKKTIAEEKGSWI